MLLCVGTVIGAIAALTAEADPGNEYLQKIASIPVLNLVIPEEKRGRAILDSYLTAFEDGENRETLRFQPFEYEWSTSVQVDDLSYVGYLNADATAVGKRQEQTVSMLQTLEMDAGGITTSEEAELVCDDETLYFKINEIPTAILSTFATYDSFSSTSYEELPMLELPEPDSEMTFEEYEDYLSEVEPSLLPDYSDVAGQTSDFANRLIGGWYKADISDVLSGSDLDFLSELDLTRAQKDDAVTAVLSMFSQDKAEYIGVEKVRGQNTYHFAYELTKQDVSQMLVALGDAIDQKISRTNAMDIADALFERSDKLEIDLWFDDSFGTVRLGWQYEVAGEEDEPFSNIVVEMSIELWNVGRVQEIETPRGADNVEDLFEY